MEALPTTIDALAEISDFSGGKKRWAQEELDEDSEEDEQNDDGNGDDDGDDDDVIDVGQGKGSLRTISVPETNVLELSSDFEGEQCVTEQLDNDDNDGDTDLVTTGTPRSTPGGGKSRRKRLRSRRDKTHAGTSNQTTPGRRQEHRIPASGPSLTAPFLTWLLWLEHCRRASEVDKKSRSAARAFAVRAGALAPVLEACFRVLRATQVLSD